MKLKKYLLILTILFIILNITCINATENNTVELELNNDNTINMTENTQNSQENNLLSQNINNQTPQQEILTQNKNEDTLSSFIPYSTQITLTVNDTTDFETTGNITINMHFSFITPVHDGEFKTYDINVYENNTLIKKINIGEQNLPELQTSTTYVADVPFNYTVHSNSYLTTSLFGEYSNTLKFENIEKIILTNLNITQINIDSTYNSNETWTNSIRSLQKALELAKNNGTINLNNIQLIQDITQTITINKNITITGNNAKFILQKTQTLLEINSNSHVTLINLTFIGNNNYIISNKGNLKLINCTFKDNSLGLINNTAELEIINCKIEDINQFYQTRPQTNNKGLINNNNILKIINTTFNNNHYVPYQLPSDPDNWDGIIYNKATLTAENVNFTNINSRIIYNDGEITLKNTIFENIHPANTKSIYIKNTNQQLNKNYTYNNYITTTNTKTINGGSIYNNNITKIENSIFNKITGSNGGVIYNTQTLTITQTNISNINTKGNGGIYNTGTLTINSSSMTKCSATYGSATYNTGTLNITGSTISQSGQAISNENKMTITQTNLINNGRSIINEKTGEITLSYSTIKDNTITVTSYGDDFAANFIYYGTIKNHGTMNVLSCIFDNNALSSYYPQNGGIGAANIYNDGRITVMYCFLLKASIYTAMYGPAPATFLYNDGTSNVNYNYFTITPDWRIIRNADFNYYFTPSFENDYYPIKLNETKNITLTLGVTNGENTIIFNDWDKLPQKGFNTTINTINENGEYINITTILNDYYTFNFNYTNIKGEYLIYANILNYRTAALIDVGKESAEMLVTYNNNNITYNDGNNITFKIKIAGNLTTPTGNITLTLNNQKYNVNLTDGECDFTVPSNFKPGNYTIKIEYNGDSEYFKILKKYYNFTIFKIPTAVNITAPEVKYSQTGTITIKLTPDTAKLYGTLYIDGKKIKDLAVTDTITQTINRGVGIYNLTLIIDEDEYYTGCSASTLFIVSKWNTNLTVESADIKKGENATLNITINPGDVRGDAILQINNETQNIFINNTMTPITLTDLEEGTYHVTVYYPGDRKYAASNASTTFSVSRITSKLTVQLTQNINLTGHMEIQTDPLNCTGEVIIFINNDKTILNLTDGVINTEIKFKRGTNYIYVHYDGDDTYSVSTWNTTINIEGNPVLTLETQKLESGKTGYVRVNLTDTNNIPYEYTNITIEFQNTNTTITTNENGTAYLPINTQTGTYTIKATYQNATITKNITVKTLTQIKVNIQNINQADDLLVYATLTDSNSNKLNGEIILEINGNYYKIIITNGAGSRNLGEFKAGTYTYTATYPENNILYSTNTIGSFKVNRDSYKITGNTDITQYYGSTKYYKIRLTNNNQPVKNEIITVNINKNTVKIKTDNQGYATLKLSLKAGKYTITATYKNVKASNKITVKPTLITKNKKIKKGKTLTYTAKLLNKNGKPLKNKKITFKINGKKYKAKTNKKGIAKIKVKNLKVGKYKIITTYGKQKNTNTITVKK